MELTINRDSNKSLCYIIIIAVITIVVLVTTIHLAYHPVGKHKEGSLLAMVCLDGNGSNNAYKIFTKGQERRIWTCHSNVNWYIIITTTNRAKVGDDPDYQEITSFELEDETIEEYITRITKVEDDGSVYATQVDEQILPGINIK
jgi:hypothetical protein